MTIDGFNVYGTGIHETILLSPDGQLSINNMIAIPDTFCVNDNIPCDFDQDSLQIIFGLDIQQQILFVLEKNYVFLIRIYLELIFNLYDWCR